MRICNMKIAFLDTNLSFLCMAHEILDNINCEIHFFTEAAEVGMYGEKPGIIDNWPLLRPDWVSPIFSQEPNHQSTAIRQSWFRKAISIALANRNCIFHLRTKVKNVNSSKIEFVGAGFSGSGNLTFDHIISKQKTPDKVWYGGTLLEPIPNIDNSIIGKRPDSIIEIWSENELPPDINWLQQMQWKGTNPKNSIHSEIDIGMKRAYDFLQKNAY